MTVKKLINEFNLTLVSSPEFEDRDINGCYIGDLLSFVMSKAQEGNIWLTIQSNVNIVAVASLTNCSCIILCEGVQPEDTAIKKANEQGVIILKSDKNSFILSSELSKVI